MKNSKSPVPRKSQDSRTVLARILDMPHLEHVVPRLQPELLHRVIQSCGLEDCGEFVVLATPEQLTRIFDLDLWRSAEPGMDEQFDAERFGVWLEVLAEFDVSRAAQKLAEMDPDVVIVGLAQHARVFDISMVTPLSTTDSVEFRAHFERDYGLAACDVGGYRLFAKRTDAWEAIVAILIALDAEQPDYFHRVMRGCRALSNEGFERDGLNDLLTIEQENTFDVALDRERRRDEQGFVTPAQARAFLEMSRRLLLGAATTPPANEIARAHLRSLGEAATAHSMPRPEPESEEPVPSEDSLQATAALVDVLLEAGIIAQPPRALLNGSQDQTIGLSLIRSHMQFVFDRDPASYARRNGELTYLANTLMAGCAVQDRPFTTQEAWDAAVAVCNLGLENWPPQWIPEKSLRDDFLVDHDLVIVFQVGWTLLHRDAGMYAAERLLEVLADLRCDDPDIQMGLNALRVELSRSCRARMPWRSREALDVIAILDTPAWAALLGLIAECPVLHPVLNVSRNPRIHSVSATAFEFISDNSQIASIHEFVQSLPETLRSI